MVTSKKLWLRLAFSVSMLALLGTRVFAYGGCATQRQACVQSAGLAAQSCCYGEPSNNCRLPGESPQLCVGRYVSEQCDPAYDSCIAVSMNLCNDSCNSNCIGENGVHVCNFDIPTESCTWECNSGHGD